MGKGIDQIAGDVTDPEVTIPLGQTHMEGKANESTCKVHQHDLGSLDL